GDRYVLTNNHVVPEGAYKTSWTGVRLKSRLKDPISVVGIERDRDRDLALLELELRPDPTVVAGNRCPMPVADAPDEVPVGGWVYLLGYPVNQDLSVTPGLVSNHDDGKGRYQTSFAMNPGNSGGPAFRSNGVLAGIAVGGITTLIPEGEKERAVEVDGISFLIPAPTIRESPLYARIQALSADVRCWEDGEPTGDVVAAEPIDRIAVQFAFRETRTDHDAWTETTETYQFTFDAEEGYQVASCEVTVISANNNGPPICIPTADGRQAHLSFDLTSGPWYDRWRGWLAGTVSIVQDRW
ncbi:MAG: trypsin-like peptidase domain-containing protein, partial [Nitratireductor sp.]|nr:trypsin-like peptidase domain-containing protein [Nitratireductor sp.]